MSYIKRTLSQEPYDSAITNFLKEEGFEKDSWHGRKCMRYVASGSLYSVWVMVYPNSIGYYVEYECGGMITEGEREFDSSDFHGFLEVYKKTIDSLAYYTKD